MASGPDLAVERHVEAKKDLLLKYNSYAKQNPGLLRDKVFCLCTVCSVMPIMRRNVMAHRGRSYAHRDVDVMKGLISAAELKAAKGTKTCLPYGDYFALFRKHAAGQVDEHGNRCEVQSESPADSRAGEAQSFSPSIQPQGCPQTACPPYPEGACLGTLQHRHQCTLVASMYLHAHRGGMLTHNRAMLCANAA